MTYEEDHGYEVFGQNLFMAATDAETQPKWIITSPKKLENGKNIEYLYTGPEQDAAKMAKDICGTYRRRDEER